jgi:hypothetical protein
MKQSAGRASPDAISLVLRRRATLDHTTAGLGITSSPTMTRDVHRSTAIEAVAAEFVPAFEDRLLSFGAALVGFTLSTALASTAMVLISMG